MRFQKTINQLGTGAHPCNPKYSGDSRTQATTLNYVSKQEIFKENPTQESPRCYMIGLASAGRTAEVDHLGFSAGVLPWAAACVQPEPGGQC